MSASPLARKGVAHRPRLVAFLACRRGIASVEFAILMTMLMPLALTMIDIGYAFDVRLRVANATTSAAQYAYVNASAATSASTTSTFLANIRQVAASSAGVSLGSVTVQYNGAADGSTFANFYCASGSTPAAITLSSTGSQSAACGNSTHSGKFVTILLAATYVPFFQFLPLLNGAALSDAAVVRVQ